MTAASVDVISDHLRKGMTAAFFHSSFPCIKPKRRPVYLDKTNNRDLAAVAASAHSWAPFFFFPSLAAPPASSFGLWLYHTCALIMENLKKIKMFGVGITNKKTRDQDMATRLEECLSRPNNLVCAECSTPNPTWASILIPPTAMNASMFISSKRPSSTSTSTTATATTAAATNHNNNNNHIQPNNIQSTTTKNNNNNSGGGGGGGGSSSSSTGKKKWNHQKGKRILGVFVCHKCSNFHIQMGLDVCQVKNVKVPEQCKVIVVFYFFFAKKSDLSKWKSDAWILVARKRTGTVFSFASYETGHFCVSSEHSMSEMRDFIFLLAYSSFYHFPLPRCISLHFFFSFFRDGRRDRGYGTEW